jgi:DNA-binding SARP family transcriptional activator
VEDQAGRQPQVYPGNFASDRSEWFTIQEHLKSLQYEEAAYVLQKLKSIAEQKDDITQANILAAAHQICLTCNQNQEEIRLRQQSLALAVERQQEMQAQLRAVLQLVTEYGCAQLPPAQATHSATDPKEQEQKNEMTLWQRAWAFLHKRIFWDLEAPDEVDLTDRSPPHDEVPPAATTESLPDRHDPPNENDNKRLKLALSENEDAESVNLPDLPALLSDEAKREPTQPTELAEPSGPTLVVYCLGVFRVYHKDRLISDWNGLKGQSVFKYLLFQRKRPIAKDVLMDMFWPDMGPEAARRNLHQAIYSLRQSLKQRATKQQYIIFENDCYALNPAINIWLDFEAFERHGRNGRRLEAQDAVAEAMAEYGIAEGLYQGDFLEDDLYEDWTSQPREQFRNLYLEVTGRLSEYYLRQKEYSGAIALCQKVLARDSCHEPAHRRLMRCYQAQRQRHLAVRQYHTCREQLKQELDLLPAPETEALYRQLTA